MSFVASCVRLLLRPLPSTGVTRLPRYFEPLRHPIRPGLSLASCPLIPTAITAGGSRVASGLLCVHAIAIIPAGSMELVRSSVSIDCGLPCEKVRSAPAIVFSGPAQRSLMLWPARSRSRQATLSIESSGSFVASAAVSIATGWSEPVPGRELHPLKSSAFSRRTLSPTVPISATMPVWSLLGSGANSSHPGAMFLQDAAVHHDEDPSLARLFRCFLVDHIFLHPDRRDFELDRLVNHLFDKRGAAEDIHNVDLLRHLE